MRSICAIITNSIGEYALKRGGIIVYRAIELDFLRDFLKKRHVAVSLVSPSEPVLHLVSSELRQLLPSLPEPSFTMRQYLGSISDMTVYKFSDLFGCRYISFLLPSEENELLLVIGPFLTESARLHSLLELGEAIGINPGSQKSFEEYYSALPIIPENDSFFDIIDTFCRRIWLGSPYETLDLSRRISRYASPVRKIVKEYAPGDVEERISVMETRYAFENELMEAVSLGNRHKIAALTAAMNETPFEKRTADPLRNAKNYSIIMNTLLRKSAEKGGVHPLYLDGISSRFAELIEKCGTVKETIALIKEMFSDYCGLVHELSTKKYSQTVEKAVLVIDADLTADLSLRSLAARQGISEGYLATVFKKETGKTVSQYVWEKRILHAGYLLKNTALQVQTVASHCGIMDVQYFSKAFKRLTGQTPKEYRETSRQ